MQSHISGKMKPLSKAGQNFSHEVIKLIICANSSDKFLAVLHGKGQILHFSIDWHHCP